MNRQSMQNVVHIECMSGSLADGALNRAKKKFKARVAQLKPEFQDAAAMLSLCRNVPLKLLRENWKSIVFHRWE